MCYRQERGGRLAPRFLHSFGRGPSLACGYLEYRAAASTLGSAPRLGGWGSGVVPALAVGPLPVPGASGGGSGHRHRLLCPASAPSAEQGREQAPPGTALPPASALRTDLRTTRRANPIGFLALHRHCTRIGGRLAGAL